MLKHKNETSTKKVTRPLTLYRNPKFSPIILDTCARCVSKQQMSNAKNQM